MTKAIINFASGRYIKGQDRLLNSLTEVGFDGKFLSWTKEISIGAPLHKDNPYAFKVFCFEQAFLNYDLVLLVDASVWAIKDVTPIFDHIEKEGYIMQEAGQHCGVWSNDKCLDYFGINRDEAMKMLMYGNAGLLGLNKNDEKAMEFFTRWRQSMLDGIFKGSWNNDNNCESTDPRCKGHRHDMISGSIIANQLDMKYQSAHDWMNYGTEPKNDKVYLLAQGV